MTDSFQVKKVQRREWESCVWFAFSSFLPSSLFSMVFSLHKLSLNLLTCGAFFKRNLGDDDDKERKEDDNRLMMTRHDNDRETNSSFPLFITFSSTFVSAIKILTGYCYWPLIVHQVGGRILHQLWQGYQLEIVRRLWCCIQQCQQLAVDSLHWAEGCQSHFHWNQV